ncbi:MAG TPA: acyl carrier protein [Cellvibrionaceae bacterium]|nr:acyl carrier protein [Cellvibrionaceae bacterium]
MNQAEALALIAEIFECPNTLAPSTQKHNVRGWDSMGVLSLMAEFDDRFSILLTQPQLEQMKTVDDILQVLRDHGHLAA